MVNWRISSICVANEIHPQINTVIILRCVRFQGDIARLNWKQKSNNCYPFFCYELASLVEMSVNAQMNKENFYNLHNVRTPIKEIYHIYNFNRLSYRGSIWDLQQKGWQFLMKFCVRYLKASGLRGYFGDGSSLLTFMMW